MKKNIDAVKMMRKIRDELSQRYLENPEQQKQDLKKIRDKYPPKSKAKSWKNKAG
jgi:hypothetical protein